LPARDRKRPLAIGGHRIAEVPGAGMPGRGHAPLPLSVRWAKAALGQSPSRTGAPVSPRARTGRKAIAGRLISLGRPVSDKKNNFLFFFYYLKMEWFGKCLTTQICSKSIQINFARFLIIRSTWEKYCMSRIKYFSVEFLFNH
jgi:hypothetical protein